jgi:2',3'-cyclic-nucleotide 2'-phosphodiesterase (5'-nucleotidase family)
MIDVYSMNDFHGAVAENFNNNEPGLARIGTFFEDKKIANPDRTTILSSGDFWQGSADSNITRGRLVGEGMNMIGFEAMAIGNHEFDWGADVITSNAALSDFPFLGANIFDKRTGNLASFAEPYVLLEKQGVQVGVIGTIGSSLESSILASAVMDYDFVPYTQIVNDHAQTLRNQGADIIVLINHDGQVESGVLPNVDAVFNGHTHRVESAIINQTPVMQAGAYGRAVAQVRFEYNLLSHSIVSSTMTMHQNLTSLTPNTALNELYQTYLVNEINIIKNEVVGIANGNFNTSILARLAVLEMLSFGLLYDARVAFHNSGGVRASITSGTVTYGDIYRSFPFDNELMIVEVTGSELKTWLSYNLVSYGVLSNKTQFMDGSTINNTQIYKIISINYLTEKHWVSSDYPHNLETAINSFEYVRELIKQAWLAYGTLNAIDY